MVRASKILFAIAIWSGFCVASDLDFRVQYSKPQIYRGESITANFILRTKTLSQVEVEVAKFPEFRNFWSENLSLRQGPLMFQSPPGIDGLVSGIREVLVGSYSITPMVEGPLATALPMKILTRLFKAGQFQEETLTSEGDFPPIRELPPVPAGLDASAFHGAVGRFQISPERRDIPFRTGEPVSVRFVITGEGNFPEITELNLTLPPHAEVLSKRLFQQVTQPTGNKLIDYTLKIDSEQSTALSARLVYFDPFLKKYETWNSPEIHFTWVPPVVETVPEIPEELESTEPTLQESWSAVFVSTPAKLIYALLTAFIGFAFFRFIRRTWLEAKARYHRSWAFEKKTRAGKVESLFQTGEWKSSLSTGRALAVEILCRRLDLNSPELTAQQLLELAPSKFSHEEIATLRQWIDFADKSYSPQPPTPSTDSLAPFRTLISYQ